MTINFPNSPIVGEYFVTGGLTYQYTGTVWVSINTKTNNAYNQANTATIIASNAFTQANSSFIHANAAFLQANSANIYAFGAHVTANGAQVHANAAFLQANSANIYAFGAHRTANSAQVHANAAFLQANSANIYAFGAHRTANSAQVHANAAFLQANSANIYAFGAHRTANSAQVHANAAFAQANLAYTSSVFKTGNTMTGNLVMSGANIAFSTNSNAGIYWGGSGLSFIHSPNSNVIVFGTSSVERMRIDSAGRVGIGTSSPAATLDVVGNFSTAKANAQTQTLTDGVTINWDTSLGQVATVTLTGNRTLNNSTNLRVGTYILHVIQDGVGGRTLSFQRGYKFTGNVIPTLTSAANSRDIFSFVSDGTNLYGAFIPDVRS